MFTKSKFKPFFLVFNISKRFDLYDEEMEIGKLDDDNCKKPTVTYILQESCFYIKSKKQHIIDVFILHTHNRELFGFNRIEHIDAGKHSRIRIRCVNSFDFGDLIRHLREGSLKEIKRDMKKKKKKKKKKKEEEEEEEDDNNNTNQLKLPGSSRRRRGQNFSVKRKTDVKASFDTDITNWSCSNVKLWAKDVLVGKKFETNLADIGGSYINENQINGMKIMLWEDEDRKNFIDQFKNQINFTERRRIISELKSMKDTGIYDNSINSLTKKVLNMMKFRGGDNFKALDLIKLRKKIGKRTEIQEMIKTILYDSNLENISNPRTFTVKVNIVENILSARKKRMRKVLGKFLEVKDTLKKSPSGSVSGKESSTEFGIFHSSLTIGSLQLEWVDTEVALVRSASSEKAILCMDVGKLTVKDGNEFSDYLAKELHKWNVSYTYNNLKTSETVANCQTFVQRMLKFIGLDWEVSPKVKKFLDSMKYSGVCDKIFKYDKKFADTFFKNSKTREFRPKTHEELDIMVQGLFRICPTFERDYNDEYMLLKGFDRAWWLQYFQNKSKINREKKKEEEEAGEVEEGESINSYRPAQRTDEGDENYRLNGCPFTKRSVHKKDDDYSEEKFDEFSEF